ncbi:arylsulfatase A-like enzyme [Lewinella aquimaris]|uniref:Arylsulfatase A-like enzyme n=1 Tax=Neolewinella aquimaris TaxID=1835722 RepID=A0A840E616_9BACT|nr:sulfatase-like hydrolase/transferase [Neolewinella aquimaris]MBB4078627.1 arylsulfatase A-like enzyme [Neolewinella aquimaris]
MFRKFLPFAGLLCCCLFWACGETAETSGDEKKYNVLFIFSDDQTFSTVGALGSTTIHTPNLDRLVNSGTTFTHAYNMGAWNGAVCLASRAMLNCGRSVWHADQFRQGWISGDSTAFQQSWGPLMADAGYATYMTGKWHIDAPANEFFERTGTIRAGMPEDAWGHAGMGKAFKELGDGDPATIMPVGYNRPLGPDDRSWSPTDTARGGFWKEGRHWSEVVADEVLTFIESIPTDPRPDFLYVAFNAPHDPRQAPQRFQDMYPVDSMALPASFRPLDPDRMAMGAGPALRDEALAPFPRTPYAVRTHRSEYYALITHLDEQIGRVLDALEESGEAERTIIIYTSDHGLAVGNHGLIGKQNLYDHSIRVPFIIAGPGIPAGKRIDEDIYLQDAMATALDVAGIERPDYVEFNSVLPLIEGEESSYPAIYGAYTKTQRMIRKDGYKLIVYPRAEKILLFDLTADPEEINDLAGDPTQRERVETMFSDLLELQREMDDPLDLTMLNPAK